MDSRVSSGLPTIRPPHKRSLRYADLPAKHGVTVQHARTAIGRTNVISVRLWTDRGGFCRHVPALRQVSPRIFSKPLPLSMERSNSRCRLRHAR
jgi:hypothetical protein